MKLRTLPNQYDAVATVAATNPRPMHCTNEMPTGDTEWHGDRRWQLASGLCGKRYAILSRTKT